MNTTIQLFHDLKPGTIQQLFLGPNSGCQNKVSLFGSLPSENSLGPEPSENNLGPV